MKQYDDDEKLACAHSSRMRNVAGGLIVFFGIVLLLFNFDILPYEYKRYVFSWSTLLFVLAIINIVNCKTRVFGYILLMFSIIAGLRFVDVIKSYWDVVGPIALVLLGVALLTGRRHARLKVHTHKWKLDSDSPLIEDEQYLHESNVFSGSEKRFGNVEFKGGTINNMLGGCEIDLSAARLAEGDNMLEITSVLGGVSLIIPYNWDVKIKTSSFLAAVDDNRVVTTNRSDLLPDRKLIIVGSLFLSGVELKNG
ncbi:MAG: LiaF-related protein [Candidatus Kapabacteria bacterium]|nr:LiaF-related protein [Candidatus Kapabacteria bacterium]